MYIIPIFIPHAGCQHECTFCNQKIISGQNGFDIRRVEMQLVTFVKNLPVNSDKQVAFYGGSFTALATSLQIKLLEFIKAQKAVYNISSIRLSTRPDCINWENLMLLKSYGVEIIELGVQSLDNTVLALAKRGHAKEVVPKAVELIKTAGIQVGIQLMVGMQGQNWQSIIKSTIDVLALNPDLARIYSLMVLSGTELEKKYQKSEFKPLKLEETVAQAAYIWQKLQENNIKVIRIGLQAEEVLQENIIAGDYHPAFGELVVQHYYRSLIAAKLDELSLIQKANLYISYPSNLASKIIGMRKANKKYFQDNYPNWQIHWSVDESLLEVKLNFREL